MSALTLLARDPFAATFDDLVRGFLVRPTVRQQPAVRAIRFDVTEQGNAYVVTADLPGYKKEDVQVEIDGARVTISAEAKAQNETREGEKLVYSERYTGRAVRSFELGSDIDNAQAGAKFENGVLTLNLPKKSAESRKLLQIQ